VKPSRKRWRKFRFYSANAAALAVPDWWYRRRLPQLLDGVTRERHGELFDRVDYYCRLADPFAVADLGDHAVRMRDIPKGRHHTYYFDFRRIARHFDRELRVAYRFGDVKEVPAVPSLVKSRPIAGDSRNAVLMKWNRLRHYYFVDDPQHFSDKRPRAVWRGKAMGKPERITFLERYHGHPLCDAADTDPRTADGPHAGGFLTIPEQLAYRYVVSIEGRDVATNLKWILSSNSLCLMARPRYETWFMEGRLEAGRHYVELRDDHADLAERIEHYNSHPDEAAAIIRNAHDWVAQFRDKRRERQIELLVRRRDLELSGQLA